MKDLMPEDFWIRAAKKGIVIFALPGEPGLTELAGDFKIHFHERQRDFYCWLNKSMMESRMILSSMDLDGFDERKLPSPGFQLEIVMVDYNESLHSKTKSNGRKPSNSLDHNSSSGSGVSSNPNVKKVSRNEDDDVFSDSEGEDGVPKNRHCQMINDGGPKATSHASESSAQEVSKGSKEPAQQRNSGQTESLRVDTSKPDSGGASEFKVVAADASVFTFGDEEDYESE